MKAFSYLALVILLSSCYSAKPRYQTALTKSEIDAYVGALTTESSITHQELRRDSLFLFVTYPKKPELLSVGFSKKPETQHEWNNWPFLQFYYVNNELVFILQFSRDGKKGSTYYLDKGHVFDSTVNRAMPYLLQQEIDELSAIIQSTKLRLHSKS